MEPNTDWQALSDKNDTSNRTISREQDREFKVSNCYTCYNACAFKAVEQLLIIGIIANAVVVITVMKDTRLHKATFVAIACLALCDGLFLIAHIALATEIIVRSLLCSSPLVIPGKVFKIVVSTLWFAADMHISLMAIVRLIILAYPLRAHVYLTNMRIVIFSVALWIISISVCVSIFSADRTKWQTTVYLTIIWLIAYLFPLLITLIAHFVKLRYVGRDARDDGVFDRRTTIKRMSRLILLLVIFATILPMPRFLIDLLNVLSYEFPSPTLERTFRDVAVLLFVLNNAINPFIYAFMSPTFRVSLKRIFMCKKLVISKARTEVNIISRENAGTDSNKYLFDTTDSFDASSLQSLNGDVPVREGTSLPSVPAQTEK